MTWSLVFWINLPIGAVTFLMFGLFLHEGQAPRRHRIDYLGSALMMFGVGALMLALVEVGNSGEMATIATLAAGGVVALLALAAHERGAAEPILPLKLWRDRVIAVGSLSGFTGGHGTTAHTRLMLTVRRRPLTRRRVGSLLTHCWREMDSNF